jgi:glycosyl transferase family 25
MNTYLILVLSLVSVVLIVYLISILINVNESKSDKIESFTNTDLPETYVINLQINKKRLRILEKYFKRENLKFTRFPAYHGKKLNEKALVQDGTLSYYHFLRKGQLGCALSHLKLLEMIKQQKKEMALILEDDVIIPENFASRLRQLLLHLPPKWDIVFLGGCNIYGKKINKYFIQPTRYTQTYNLCMHAYLVNYRNIDKIVKYIKPFKRPIDSQLREAFHILDIYYAYPNLIVQNKNIRSTRRDLDGLSQSKYWYDNQTNITLV